MEDNRQNQRPAPTKRRGHGTGGNMSFEKPKNLGKSMKDIILYSGRYKFAIMVVILFAAAGTVFQVIGPKVMGRATTVLAEGLMHKIKGMGGIDFDSIWKILAITAALYGISALCSFIQGWIMTALLDMTQRGASKKLST